MQEKIIQKIELKIADKYPIKEKFDFGEEVIVILKGNIVKKSILDNNDGSVDLVLHFKALDYEVKK